LKQAASRSATTQLDVSLDPCSEYDVSSHLLIIFGILVIIFDSF